MVFINTTVRQNNDICTITILSVYLYIQSVDCLFKAGILIISNRNLNGLESILLHILDLE